MVAILKSLHMQAYPRHDEDFYGWAINTAALLKQKQYQEVDMDSLIQEVLKMGASDKHALASYLRELLLHLLKWQYQPAYRSTSWNISINKQRDAVIDMLEYSPGLKQFLAELQTKAYKRACLYAVLQTGLDKKTFPKDCPYTFEQLMDDEFFPE
jgi:hypothetical protein